jgi:hypothetical protein
MTQLQALRPLHDMIIIPLNSFSETGFPVACALREQQPKELYENALDKECSSESLVVMTIGCDSSAIGQIPPTVTSIR